VDLEGADHHELAHRAPPITATASTSATCE
jgi:hypothetical protein